VKKHVVIIFIWVLMITTLGLAQQTLDRIVAIVDDDVILESEIVQGAYLMAMQMQVDINKSPKEFEKMKKSILSNLVTQKLLLIQAVKDTIKADERQVESYLQQQMQGIVQQLGSEQKAEEYFGTPLTKIRRNYRDEIEKNLRAMQVRNQKLNAVKIGRREVDGFFKTKKDTVGQIQETVDISHILVTPKAGATAKAAAQEKIKTAQERLQKGEDFAELAKEFSQDPGSTTAGGDLGFMSRGDLEKPFEEAAFALQVGQVSSIVETRYGFHLIKMEERRGEKIHCRHILITPKATREDELVAADTIKAIDKQLKNGVDFEALVSKYSEDASTNQIKGHLGRFEIDQLRERAKEFVFSIKDVAAGSYSEPVRTQYGFHIIRVNNREPARRLSLEKDYERIQRMALEFKKQSAFEAWISELKENVFVEIKDPAYL
jgi:peptidyl-prolyl cis-trans isomerase SurA